jgi:ribosomal protein S13
LKSDQLILVYWARGLYYNSRVVEFIHSLHNFLSLNAGINVSSLNILLKRLEINKQNFGLKLNLLAFSTQQQYALNNELSAVASTNYPVRMLYRFNILKLFFIRSYKGICHILGKPVHGQRT